MIWDLSSDESYDDPGQPVYRILPNGHWAIRQKGDTIFLSGQGASTAGDRPFLDSFDLSTGKPRRHFRSGKDAYEYFLSFANDVIMGIVGAIFGKPNFSKLAVNLRGCKKNVFGVTECKGTVAYGAFIVPGLVT